MNFSLLGFAAIFASAARAIVISSPASGSTFIGGNTIAVTGASGFATGNANVVFSNGIYTVSQVAPITGNTWSAILTVPIGYMGQFTIVASEPNDGIVATVVVNVMQSTVEPVNFSTSHNPCYNRVARYNVEDAQIEFAFPQENVI